MGCCTTVSGTDGSYGGRSFITAKEKIAKLENYKEWLDNESTGVQETITKLKKAS